MDYKPTACQQMGQAQGDYRFTLEQAGKKMLFVIGLNPSTADESRPDRTVNRIRGFAQGGGYDGFAVFNLSAERSTDKWSLAPQLDADIEGISMPFGKWPNCTHQQTFWRHGATTLTSDPI